MNKAQRGACNATISSVFSPSIRRHPRSSPSLTDEQPPYRHFRRGNVIKIPFSDEPGSPFCRAFTEGVKSTDADPRWEEREERRSSQDSVEWLPQVRWAFNSQYEPPFHPTLPTTIRTLKSRLISRFALDRDFPPGRTSKRQETCRDKLSRDFFRISLFFYVTLYSA